MIIEINLILLNSLIWLDLHGLLVRSIVHSSKNIHLLPVLVFYGESTLTLKEKIKSKLKVSVSFSLLERNLPNIHEIPFFPHKIFECFFLLDDFRLCLSSFESL